ncbi:extracellular solute-binding protein [Paenibacillus thiaminolyticus]|uniref:ABC transporter substrate-binding protein n=1 Tax=Paenibacillus thiaminolyticus TaxID=49283 RepID=UPI002350EE2F|nr:extracellular solute-binding protein [Paenibacillus thiaminolyticus]WCR26003.1 extracellular solute-binding protein [Paenibacillus thiaminolyticus]
MKDLLRGPNIAWLLLGLILLLQGCADKETEPFDPKQPVTLKVMYAWGEEDFYHRFGKEFQLKYPNVDFRFVENPEYHPDLTAEENEQALLAHIAKERPDVLRIGGGNDLEAVAAAGKLIDLGPWMKRDNFSLDGIYPPVIDAIKMKGRGTLYGLSPTFTSSALYYNKDLFEQYGVTPPQEKMTWEQVLDLAARFPVDGSPEERIYGFDQGLSSYDSIYSFMERIAKTEQIALIDASGKRLLFDSDGWRRITKLTVRSMTSNSVYFPEKLTAGQGITLDDDLFVSGRAAMVVSGDSTAKDMLNMNKFRRMSIPPQELLRWGMVPVPIDPVNPQSANEISVFETYGIGADSTAKAAAWELVKFINSDEWAKGRSRTRGGGNLLARIAYNKERFDLFDPEEIEAFYKVKPQSGEELRQIRQVPYAFRESFGEIVREELESIAADKQSVDQAVQKIQTRGQAELDSFNARTEENNGVH